jgi:hypothetical protein
VNWKQKTPSLAMSKIQKYPHTCICRDERPKEARARIWVAIKFEDWLPIWLATKPCRVAIVLPAILYLVPDY